jgi:hypothetical protein
MLVADRVLLDEILNEGADVDRLPCQIGLCSDTSACLSRPSFFASWTSNSRRISSSRTAFFSSGLSGRPGLLCSATKALATVCGNGDTVDGDNGAARGLWLGSRRERNQRAEQQCAGQLGELVHVWCSFCWVWLK